MLKTNIKHNNYIDKEIRIKNKAFNKNWIATNGFVGKSFLSSDELDVNPSIKMDAHSFQVV
tara:strand:- start:501 stop:683 length:183 start_codon:yes stop_codon:yes gene_type:complete